MTPLFMMTKTFGVHRLAQMAEVIRFVEFDSGHRVARHESKCKHLHGHRYRLTVSVSGPIKADDSPEHGMVIDFGRVKEALMVIHDEYDHRFLVGQDDPLLPEMSSLLGIVVLPVQPTAENIAQIAFDRLGEILSPLVVEWVEIQETTSCTARVSR
jgi:6-pyruvoyltetrahydropterin/6-carboxytetrahydropterin synthase